MNKYYFFLSLACQLFMCAISGFAQKENNHWVFGNKGGIDFSSGSPVALSSAIVSREPAAAVSGRAGGNLLFYTGGDTVYDRTHAIMPNGTGLTADYSCTQGTVIVPSPADTNIYYIFAINGRDSKPPYNLCYTVVDMRLNAGLGDVDPLRKNIVIDSIMSEKMVVAPGRSCETWVIVHPRDTPGRFHSFKVDVSGVNPVPVISYCGPSSAGYARLPDYLVGEMKVSPDNKHIAATRSQYYGISPVLYPVMALDLFDFDNGTGVVSNMVEIDTMKGHPWHYYGVEFSPDSKKLYLSNSEVVAGAIGFKGVLQYNLNLLPLTALVRTFKYKVFDTVNCMGMRTGPDGRIYITTCLAVNRAYPIACITDPNQVGAACNPIRDAGVGAMDAWTLGTPVIYTPKDTARKLTDSLLCTSLHSVNIDAGPGFAFYLWDDGDVSRVKTFLDGEEKTVLKLSEGPELCPLISHSYKVSLLPSDTSFFNTDTTLCFKESLLTVELVSGYSEYEWNDGSTDTERIISDEGLYWALAKNGCTFRIDTFDVHAKPDHISARSTDSVICLTKPATLAPSSVSDVYLWDDGSVHPDRLVNVAGKYWVTGSTGCTVLTDTFHVISKANDTAYSVADTTICFNKKVLLSVAPGYESYLWSNGATGSSTEFNSNGPKWVVYRKDCSVRIDTVFTSFVDFKVDLGPDSTVCNGSTLLLEAAQANAQYRWQDGSSSSFFNVERGGTYWLEVNVDGCNAADTVNITEKTFSEDLGEDRTACRDQAIVLSGRHPGASYLWSDGSMGAELTVTQPGVYWVRTTDGNCYAADTVTISFIRCDQCFLIPNAFTPNNDQLNDEFAPKINCPVSAIFFRIFNRFGQEVYSTGNVSEGWDGRINGTPAEVGVYFYLCKVTYDFPGAGDVLYKGDVTLIR